MQFYHPGKKCGNFYLLCKKNTVSTYTNVLGYLYFQISYEMMTTDDFSDYSESEMETVPGVSVIGSPDVINLTND